LAVQFGGGFSANLSFNILSMRINRMRAQHELIGDRPGRKSLSDEPKDFQFAVSESINRILGLPNFAQSVRKKSFLCRDF
jgi:hypothetical protein